MFIPFRHHACHLAVCAALCIAAEHATAATLTVSNCSDDGRAGSLRAVIASAVSGDTVELTGLPDADPACTDSTITLAQGQIAIGTDLTIVGPGMDKLAIVGTGTKPMFYGSNAASTITFQDIAITGGKNTTSFLGGCIASVGEVDLDASTVSGCYLGATVNKKYDELLSGAGVYAHTVRLSNGSVVADNTDKLNGQGLLAFGGGVGAYQLYCTDSTISDNYATIGGGGLTATKATIQGCTINGNSAGFYGGGLIGWTNSAITVNESTISGNSAKMAGGGVYAAATLTLNNSTVAFNDSAKGGAAVATSTGMTLHSTIVAQNTNAYGTDLDVSVRNTGTIAGSYNLIMNPGTATLANGAVIVTSNPHLVPLGDHGGLTRTHALLENSAAIDLGSNTLKSATDQRGTGFARAVPAGAPDIGAYERQAVDDEIFYDGLDSG